MSTEIDEKAATTIEEAVRASISAKRTRKAALGGSLGFGVRCGGESIREEGDAVVRGGRRAIEATGECGCLVGVFGVLARFATEETLPTVETRPRMGSGARGDMWRA